ncbi:RNA ligase-domain-containing protein [Gymnopilus junonius]|uniref:RNA ligase-domain-containing protein n=1 Tax=Gymnopilus junonius TaxID=109634 RepID=A0A9P5NMH6_GYMJU|nr:RNA ligase-domain-containing protein [Gymnopilus junonius]
MNEFKYYDIPSPFPTLARGLFTRELNETQKPKKYQILVRGYDKFFNIGEVPWTTWASIEEHTAPPYVLTLKSNGCIIFIAALTPEKLVITSKHSLGTVQAVVKKYLDKLGKTEADLAAVLWEKNWTAIAELCDDSFEEHVLAYPPEKTGLHLHGLNIRSKHFITMPQDVVDEFAEQWGFIKTPSKVVNSVKEVKDFTTACAENGEWNGESVEGFVVRTHVTEPPTATDKGKGKAGSQGSSRSPYEAGSSFFFKVKFDEPYMMYRDWREVTKTLLSKGLSPSNLPRSKMKRAETKLDIAAREKFLAWMKSKDGMKDLEEVQAKEVDEEGKKVFGKTVILPVAIPGCGKTAVSVALSHIFGFGHTQSDDVHVKKAAPVFIKNVIELLDKNDVVIADKNNHLIQHRKSLRDATAGRYSQPVRLLALNWSLDKPPAMIHRICGDRVEQRGENHQTLRADTSKSHEDVIWMFINNTEELTASEVDDIIEMEVEEDLEQAVRRAVKGVAKALELEMPSEEKIQEGIEAVGWYEPKTKKPDEKKKETKKGKVAGSASGARYFGLLPEVDLIELLDERMQKDDVDEGMRQLWAKLKEGGRVTKRPHVTIVHKNSMETEKPLWDRCAALHAVTPAPPLFKGKLKTVLCNDRVMALTAEDFVLVQGSANGQNQEGADFVSKLAHEVRQRLHITVGTKAADIPAVEAKALVEGYRKGVEDGVKVLQLEGVEFKGRVKGMNG